MRGRMLRKQLLLLLGALPAFIVVFLVWRSAPRLASVVTIPSDDVSSRLAFLVRWLLLPGLTLWPAFSTRVGAAGSRPRYWHSQLRYQPSVQHQHVGAGGAGRDCVGWLGHCGAP